MNKTEKLRKNIIINSSASLILLLILGGIFFFLSKKSDINEQKIKKIKIDTAKIKVETTELEGKIKDAKKYRKVWKIIGENKKTTKAIKIDEINTILKNTSQKYNISKTNIQITLPVELDQGIFKRKTLKILHATGSLSFESLDDIKSVLFTEEFFKNLPGYFIITSIKIKRNKEYTQQDFVKISSGESNNAIATNISFSWYSYREK